MSFRAIISSLIPVSIRKKIRTIRALSEWKSLGWSVPAPHAVKIDVLKRYSNSKMTWVETGTWMGDTTSALSAMAFHVHTIEPQLDFVNLAKIRFKNVGNVSLHFGTSEQLFGRILKVLVDWATDSGLSWTVEHDIFVAFRVRR